MTLPTPSEPAPEGAWFCIVSKTTGMRGPFAGEYPEADAKRLLNSLTPSHRGQYELFRVADGPVGDV